MKKGILILLVIFKSIFSFSNEKDKLIVVYSKDCNYSKKLINQTFENLTTKENLKKYSLKKLEISEAKSIIKEYKIVEFPTQIIKKNGKLFFVKGFQNVEQQNKILLNPNKYEKDKPLSKRAQMFICSYVKNRASFEKILSTVEKVAGKEGIEVGNIYKFISDRQHEIICKNTKHVRMRDSSSLFKFAVDTGNYAFVEDLIDHDEDGECNANIAYNKIEILPDGSIETLKDFLDKLIYNIENEGFSAAHKKSDVVHIRGLLKGCFRLIKESKNKLCYSILNQKSFEDFFNTAKSFIDKEENIIYSDFNDVFTNKTQGINCVNEKKIKLRKNSSDIIKYALDVGNYKFVENYLKFSKNKKCNKHVDYEKEMIFVNNEGIITTISSKEKVSFKGYETILEFLNKLLEKIETNDSFKNNHKRESLIRIKNIIENCSK